MQNVGSDLIFVVLNFIAVATNVFYRWNPTRPEFCVVYGFMPAKATVFNSKCDKVFDYGTGSRNMALYNPQV